MLEALTHGRPLWVTFYKEKIKKILREMFWTEPCSVFTELYMQPDPAGKVREPSGVCCCSKMPRATAKVHFPPKEP